MEGVWTDADVAAERVVHGGDEEDDDADEEGEQATDEEVDVEADAEAEDEQGVDDSADGDDVPEDAGDAGADALDALTPHDDHVVELAEGFCVDDFLAFEPDFDEWAEEKEPAHVTPTKTAAKREASCHVGMS